MWGFVAIIGRVPRVTEDTIRIIQGFCETFWGNGIVGCGSNAHNSFVFLNCESDDNCCLFITN